jgi:hypothetical protein
MIKILVDTSQEKKFDTDDDTRDVNNKLVDWVMSSRYTYMEGLTLLLTRETEIFAPDTLTTWEDPMTFFRGAVASLIYKITVFGSKMFDDSAQMVYTTTLMGDVMWRLAEQTHVTGDQFAWPRQRFDIVYLTFVDEMYPNTTSVFVSTEEFSQRDMLENGKVYITNPDNRLHYHCLMQSVIDHSRLTACSLFLSGLWQIMRIVALCDGLTNSDHESLYQRYTIDARDTTCVTKMLEHVKKHPEEPCLFNMGLLHLSGVVKQLPTHLLPVTAYVTDALLGNKLDNVIFAPLADMLL